MEPLHKWHSTWYQAYWAIYYVPHRSPAWDLVEGRLWRRFDYFFAEKGQ